MGKDVRRSRSNRKKLIMIRHVEVCVVAHNEAEFIDTCLVSIESALGQLPSEILSRVHIVNNGSTDNSDIIIDKFCSTKNDAYDAVHIALGDKSNAWNVALYERVQFEDSLIIFVDGDCTVNPESFSAIIDAAIRNPNAYLLAAIPEPIGRYSEIITKNTLQGRALSGNFYAITPLFHQKLKQTQFTLPVGLIGDDSLLAWAAQCDFKLSKGVKHGLLVGVENARFGYHRLVPNSFTNVRMYWRRLQRYSLRHLQQCCIKEYLTLENDEFASLPDNIEALYTFHSLNHIRTDSRLNNFLDNRTSKVISNASGK